ncbi:MAG: hypothetical protein C0483_18325 [Pirellula sp.]|nr:hypothetical protein [Pirellula sp.]
MAALIDRFVLDTLAKVWCVAPPVDAIHMAKRLGMIVLQDARLQGRARRVQLSVGSETTLAAVYVRPEPRPERRQWAVAHELGEHFAAEVLAALGIETDEATPERREQSAHLFAERLLLPQAWLMREGQACSWDLCRLKERFSTASHELIARRVVACLPAAVVTVVDDGSIHWRRDARGRRPRLLPEERALLEDCRVTGTPRERIVNGVRLRCWPIHEAEHRREILLTQAGDRASESGCDD